MCSDELSRTRLHHYRMGGRWHRSDTYPEGSTVFSFSAITETNASAMFCGIQSATYLRDDWALQSKHSETTCTSKSELASYEQAGKKKLYARRQMQAHCLGTCQVLNSDRYLKHERKEARTAEDHGENCGPPMCRLQTVAR